MEFSEILKIGELFEIETEDIKTRSKLQEVQEDGGLVIMQPSIKGIPVRTNRDIPAVFTFCRQDGVYQFDAYIEGHFTRENIRLSLCRPSSGMRKTQRRKHFRLTIVLDAMLKLTHKDGEKTRLKAKTEEISETAMRISCFTFMKAGEVYGIRIKLPDGIMELEGRVLKCMNPQYRKDPYNVVLLYEDMPLRLRKRLGRFILKQQVLARKNNSDTNKENY